MPESRTSSNNSKAKPVLQAGLIGNGIAASLTPAMHEAEGCELGLDYTYRFIDTGSDEFRGQSLAQLVDMAESNNYAGVNITYPYKAEILQYAGELSANVQALGAANTVVFANGKRIAHSTDYSGFSKSLERDMARWEKNRVLLVGAGGGGSAVAFALADWGVEELLIYDIDAGHSRALSGRLGEHRPQLLTRLLPGLDKAALAGVSGIVNATPMGMAKHPGTAIAADLLLPAMWVADIVYFPLETELLATARAVGCKTMDGSGMAVFQAVHAFELFSGLKADPDRFVKQFKRLTATDAL